MCKYISPSTNKYAGMECKTNRNMIFCETLSRVTSTQAGNGEICVKNVESINLFKRENGLYTLIAR